MNTICYCVSALDSLPCIMPVSILRMVSFYPAYCGRIEYYISTHEGIYPCSFRKPLVIAYKNAYGSKSCFIDPVSEVTLLKIIFFVKQGVKRYMELAIHAEYAAVCIYRNGRVVVIA